VHCAVAKQDFTGGDVSLADVLEITGSDYLWVDAPNTRARSPRNTAPQPIEVTMVS
jgi:hypothetical protein